MALPVGHPAPASVVALVESAFRADGIDLARVALAWARATPAITLVPAFGLKALPAPARAVVAFALAAAVFPALPAVTTPGSLVWIALLQQLAAGIPIAVAAAVPLWAATMAGGVADALRGSSGTTEFPTVEGSATSMGVAFSLLGSCMCFATGGPARVAASLIQPMELHPALRAATDIAGGITIAVALAAPLLAASLVVEVAGALIARAASPAQLHLLLAPIRALALLVVLALVFTRMSEALASVVAHARI